MCFSLIIDRMRLCLVEPPYRFFCREDNAMTKSVAVLGAGIVGLSTAVRLQSERPELRITLVADSFGEDTASHGAAGILLPHLDMYPNIPTVTLRWGGHHEGYIEGVLPKGPYLPCVSMTVRALLAGYPRHIVSLQMACDHIPHTLLQIGLRSFRPPLASGVLYLHMVMAYEHLSTMHSYIDNLNTGKWPHTVTSEHLGIVTSYNGGQSSLEYQAITYW